MREPASWLPLALRGIRQPRSRSFAETSTCFIAPHASETNLSAVVDGLVGRNRDGEELPAELEHRLVLEDDRPAVLTGALDAKLVDGCDVVAGRDLSSQFHSIRSDL